MNSFRESSPVLLHPWFLFGLVFVFGGKVLWFGFWVFGDDLFVAVPTNCQLLRDKGDCRYQ